MGENGRTEVNISICWPEVIWVRAKNSHLSTSVTVIKRFVTNLKKDYLGRAMDRENRQEVG